MFIISALTMIFQKFFCEQTKKIALNYEKEMKGFIETLHMIHMFLKSAKFIIKVL